MEIEQKKFEPSKVRLPEVKPPIPADHLKERSAAQSIDTFAQKVLDMLYATEPAWKERDEACAAEWGLSPAQRIIRYCTIVLDQQAHLNLVPGYDFLEPGNMNLSPMTGKCPACEKEFNRQYPGQVCCSNECGDKHFTKPEPKVPEYDDAFNKAVAEQMESPPSDGPPMAAYPVGSGIR